MENLYFTLSGCASPPSGGGGRRTNDARATTSAGCAPSTQHGPVPPALELHERHVAAQTSMSTVWQTARAQPCPPPTPPLAVLTPPPPPPPPPPPSSPPLPPHGSLSGMLAAPLEASAPWPYPQTFALNNTVGASANASASASANASNDSARGHGGNGGASAPYLPNAAAGGPAGGPDRVARRASQRDVMAAIEAAERAGGAGAASTATASATMQRPLLATRSRAWRCPRPSRRNAIFTCLALHYCVIFAFVFGSVVFMVKMATFGTNVETRINGFLNVARHLACTGDTPWLSPAECAEL